MVTRTCDNKASKQKCFRILPEEQFEKKGGYALNCKDCREIYNKKLRDSSAEKKKLIDEDNNIINLTNNIDNLKINKSSSSELKTYKCTKIKCTKKGQFQFEIEFKKANGSLELNKTCRTCREPNNKSKSKNKELKQLTVTDGTQLCSDICNYVKPFIEFGYKLDKMGNQIIDKETGKPILYSTCISCRNKNNEKHNKNPEIKNESQRKSYHNNKNKEVPEGYKNCHSKHNKLIIEFIDKNGIERDQCNDCRNSTKRCEILECNKYPYFNYPGKTSRIFCNDHRLNGMIDIKNKLCVLDCGTRVERNGKYRNHCLRCFINTFPTERVSKLYKVKEQYVIDFLKETYPNKNIEFNKEVKEGCSKRKPDAYIDLLTYIIIIECDENQHRFYDPSCENKRMGDLFNDLGKRPIICIRFNPDSYKKIDGSTEPSSFIDVKDLNVPKIRLAKEWNSRLKLLKITIDKYLNIDGFPDKEWTIESLFMDEINYSDESETDDEN